MFILVDFIRGMNDVTKTDREWTPGQTSDDGESESSCLSSDSSDSGTASEITVGSPESSESSGEDSSDANSSAITSSVADEEESSSDDWTDRCANF